MEDDTFTGNMSDNLNDRIEYFIKEANLAWNNFAHEFVKSTPELNNEKISNIFENAINKYRTNTKLLVNIIKSKEEKIKKGVTLNKDDINQYSMSAMILSGSILEATIQFFLFVFLDDYKKDPKFHWVVDNKEVDFNKIKEEINKTLDTLVGDSTITSKHKRRIKDAVNKVLSSHEDWINISRYSLNDLIDFCIENDIFLEKENNPSLDNDKTIKKEIKADPNDHLFNALCEGLESKVNRIYFNMDRLKKDDIENGMKFIQFKRNNIHIFTENDLCNVEETDEAIKTLCRIINELGSRISSRNESFFDNQEDIN